MRLQTPLILIILLTGVKSGFTQTHLPQDSILVNHFLSQDFDENPSINTKKYEEASAVCEKNHWWNRRLLAGYKYMEWLSDSISQSKAIEEAEKLIDISLKRLSQPDSLLADIYHKKGTYHYNLDQYDEAQEAFLSALDIRKSIDKKSLDVGHSLYNLGALNRWIENYYSAAIYLEEAIEVLKENNSIELLADAYFEYGLMKFYLGDLGVADQYMSIGLRMYKEIRNEVREKNNIEEMEFALWDLGYAYNNISSLHHYTEDHGASKEALEKAIDIYSELNYEFNLASSYKNLGSIYYHMKNYEPALDFYRKAEVIFRRKNNLLELSGVFHNTGILLKAKEDEREHRLRNYGNANSFFQKSLSTKRRLLKNTSYHPKYSEDFKYFGDIHLAKGKLTEALTNYQLAIVNQFENYRNTNPLHNPDLDREFLLGSRIDLLEYLNNKAEALLQLYWKNNELGVLEQAHTTFKLCDELINDIRIGFESNDSKLYLQKNALSLYENAIASAAELHEITKDAAYLGSVFRFMEKSRALLLLGRLKDTQAKSYAQIPPEILTRINNYKNRIAYQEKQIILAKLNDDNSPITSEEINLPILKREYNDFIKELEKKYPEYHREKFNLEIVEPTAVKRHLEKTQSVLLEYFVGEKHTYIYFLSADTTHLFKIPVKSSELALLVTDMVQNMRSISTVLEDQMIAKYRESAHELYQILWQPFAQYLTDQQPVTIIPVNELGYVPFGALLKKRETDNKFKNYSYLIKEHPICFAYSATILFDVEQPSVNKDKITFLGIAPVFENHADFDDLSEEEVLNINKLFPGRVLLREKATRNAFFLEAPKADIVHLCTHASIRKAPFDAQFELYDGPINISEIDTMGMPIEMIVLSACETGIGELEKGEGILSLSRWFTRLGCRSIISSLWKVNEQSTTQIMEVFYQMLAQNTSKDIALQQAQRKFLSSENLDHGDAHPYFWAGFLQYGSKRAIPVKKRSHPYVFWFGIILVTGLILFLVRRRSEKPGEKPSLLDRS